MGLHPGLAKVLHDLGEGGHDGGMLVVLDVGTQVCAHLSNCLAGCPSDFGMGVL